MSRPANCWRASPDELGMVWYYIRKGDDMSSGAKIAAVQIEFELMNLIVVVKMC